MHYLPGARVPEPEIRMVYDPSQENFEPVPVIDTRAPREPDVVIPSSMSDMDYLEKNEYQCQIMGEYASSGVPVGASGYRCYYIGGSR